MSKLDAIREVLATFPAIRDWYVNEHGVDPAQFSHESVRTYGAGAPGVADGEIADMILAEPEAADIAAKVD